MSAATTPVPPDWRNRAMLRPSLVAAVTGLALSKVYRMLDSGQLECRRIAETRLVPVRAVLEMVGENVPESTAEGAPCARVNPRARAAVARMRGMG